MTRQIIISEGFSTKPATVRGYIEDLQKAKIVYECNRFDIKTKKAIKRNQKYYLSDLAIYFSMNTDNRLSYGPSLENIIYLFLVSNDYHVAYTLRGEDAKATERIKEREYRPFRDIKDGYPRYIISLDKYRDQQEGVHHINAIDLFLGKEK